jgi:hypothetical protein
MRELRRFYRKKLKKHRWFLLAVLVLILGFSGALILSPSAEKGGPWHLPQIQPAEVGRS